MKNKLSHYKRFTLPKSSKRHLITVIVTDDFITLRPSGPTDDAGDIYHSQELFMNDLYIYYAHADGWLYLVDSSSAKVGQFNGYHFSHVDDLMKGKEVIVPMVDYKGNYDEYDFNI